MLAECAVSDDDLIHHAAVRVGGRQVRHAKLTNSDFHMVQDTDLHVLGVAAELVHVVVEAEPAVAVLSWPVTQQSHAVVKCWLAALVLAVVNDAADAAHDGVGVRLYRMEFSQCKRKVHSMVAS